MRVRIKAERCVGHAMCYLAAPEIFVLSDEDGRASVTVDVVPEEFQEAVRQAARSCPEEAVDIY
ncbi:ferredoxin [Sphingobium subterraneum]|uniref:Ferredoxin n=1 Tax=Sphingobium subterraneum TaxID=627688 RepID=A0A841JB55_9SPHN|nr:ferredoxin [Sphingobium subterraneum]MBB6125351.1 ferredoxin [Sphingobium subterraneum]